ncbi:uncharacterized protein M421DRAFT_94172 [Didymella exigua CBS 183.55]|uniref:Uncharacterized protein n=1 Tax=Didymella exigua CBS 183.55 TaxID=1150837 RepID=A0A6A5RF10_9PLEO|nr:uncharacterized protein M421DRAFT_94172 [Didymella exigua CBS 183.55]KAF1926029.1 hypothetical protein M421DRAFT_94172 [Didymella exigua CBS 183.55]
MATTRLRKTFNYPDSSDDEDTVEAGLDAEDQAEILSSLHAQDGSSTHLYTSLLLLLPAAIALLTLPGLVHASTFAPSLLALASLAASAYTLYYLPLPPRSVGIIVDGQRVGKRNEKATGRCRLNAAASSARGERVEVPWLSSEVQGILARYIVPGNGAVCSILAVAELVQRREWREGMMIGGGYLPGLVLTVVLWARRELRVVDMSELQQLRS